MTGKRLAAIAIAVVAAIVAWFVIENLGNVELMTPTMQGRPSMEISAVPIALSVIVATLIGWGAMSLIERRAQTPRRTWTTLAVIGAPSLARRSICGRGARYDPAHPARCPPCGRRGRIHPVVRPDRAEPALKAGGLIRINPDRIR